MYGCFPFIGQSLPDLSWETEPIQDPGPSGGGPAPPGQSQQYKHAA